MRYITLILMIIFCGDSFAQIAKSSDNVVDLTSDVQLALHTMPINVNEGIYNHSLIERNGRVNLIYNRLDSLYFISMKSVNELNKYVDINTYPSFIDQDLSFIYLPRRRFEVLFATSKHGKFIHLHSLNSGRSWVDPVEGEFYTTSPVKLCYRRNFTDIEAYMWGRGNLTSSGGNDRSMLFSTTSYNGGNRWQSPDLVLKHNLYSLDAGSLALHRKRHKKQVVRNKHDKIYVVAIDSLSGRAFVSNSLETSKFSYPARYTALDNTYLHNFSIYKHTGAILYIKRSSDSGNIELWVHTTPLDRLYKESGRLKRHYKLFTFRDDEDIDDIFFDGYINENNQLILTVARKWENGDCLIKYAKVLLNRYN